MTSATLSQRHWRDDDACQCDTALTGTSSTEQNSQQDPESVLAEIRISRNRPRHLQAFHNDKALSIAERVRLIGVPSDERNRVLLVVFAHPLDSKSSSLEVVEKFNGVCSASSRPVQQQCVGLDDDGIRRDQLPAFRICLLEDAKRFVMRRVSAHEQGEEASAVDEDALAHPRGRRE